jgi:hypothetical protein
MVTTYKVFALNTTTNGDVTIQLGMAYAPKVLHVMSNINVYPHNVTSIYVGSAVGNLVVTYDSNTTSGLPSISRCVHLQDAAGNVFSATIKTLTKDSLVLNIINTSTIPYSAYVYITAY